MEIPTVLNVMKLKHLRFLKASVLNHVGHCPRAKSLALQEYREQRKDFGVAEGVCGPRGMEWVEAGGLE